MMRGCFQDRLPHVLRRSVVSLFDSIPGFNPSIVRLNDGFLISKRVDWVNGCGTRPTNVRTRKTIFLQFDEGLNFLEEVSEKKGWVDTRLFEHRGRIYTSFLATRMISRCHSCLWQTHLAEWSRKENVNTTFSCDATLGDFCGTGRNHAFATPTEWLEQLEPSLVFHRGTKTITSKIVFNKTCSHRLSLTSPLVAWDTKWFLGIGHIHRSKTTYTKFGSGYTHFFFLFRPPQYIILGKEWCIASRSDRCDDSVQFASGLAKSYTDNEFIVTYGAKDCYARAFRMDRHEIHAQIFD